MSQQNISFSTWTIVKVVLVLLGLWLVWVIRDVIVMLFVAIILASIFDPVVDFFERKKIPRILGVLLVYLVFLIIFGLIIGFVVPPVIEQIKELATNFPTLWGQIVSDFSNIKAYTEEHGVLQGIQQLLQTMETGLTNISRGILAGLLSVFGGALSFLIILVLTFYLLTQENAIKRFFESIIPIRFQPYLFDFFSRFQDKLKLWARGQLVLCFIVFLLIFIGLSILGVKYALVLALLAGILELVPYLGPLLSGIMAVFLGGLTGGLLVGLLVIALFLVVNQLENHLIVPKVMQQAVGLNPIVSIIALITGAKLAGIVGVLLAIPVALFVSIITKELLPPVVPIDKK